MGTHKGMHDISRKIEHQLLLPWDLGVNENIALFAKNLRKSLVTFDPDVGSLTKKSFLLAGQLDG